MYAIKLNLQFTCLTLSVVRPSFRANEGARGVQQFKNDHDARPR